MSQKTVVNGLMHVHAERPFAPPHESPLDQRTHEAFGCSSKELGDRTLAVEEVAFEVIHDFIYKLDAEVRERAGETATEIVKWALAQALVRAGAVGQCGLLTGNVSRSLKFGREAQKAVCEAAIMVASAGG